MVDRVVAQESSSEALVTSDVAQGMVAAADPEYLQRALSNILRNAIRYAGGTGPIRILAESSDGKVRLVVEDCGPGLPEGELDAVFSPFYRPDAVRTPGTGGAGLGLAIVKGCVEACEGTVICRNRKPSGLEVAIELRSCTFSDNRKDVAKN
jgi:two-component system sensor histidine kinase CpxA